MSRMVAAIALIGLMFVFPTHAQISRADIDSAVGQLESKLIATRRDLHAHPELSNRETRTAKLVEEREA